MLVKCIGNSPVHLSGDQERRAYEQNIHQNEVWLEIGKEYFVYGVSFRDGDNAPWYWVIEEDDEYPKPHLGAFFDVVDGEIPQGWVFTPTSSNAGDVALLPKCWASDPCFLEKLYNGESDALACFRQLAENS